MKSGKWVRQISVQWSSRKVHLTNFFWRIWFFSLDNKSLNNHSFLFAVTSNWNLYQLRSWFLSCIWNIIMSYFLCLPTWFLYLILHSPSFDVPKSNSWLRWLAISLLEYLFPWYFRHKTIVWNYMTIQPFKRMHYISSHTEFWAFSYFLSSWLEIIVFIFKKWKIV